MNCDYCDKETDDLQELNDAMACDDCYSNRKTCHHCDGEFHPDDVEYIGDGRYACEECRGQYEECHGCSYIDHYDNMHAARGHYFCSTCHEDRFIDCYECGAQIDMEVDHYVETGYGDILCEECRYSDEEDIIHEWDYKPRAEYYTFTKKTPDTLFMGIELETEFGPDCSVSSVLDKLSGSSYYYLKHDGSLEYGVEIVSHPATFEWLVSEFDKNWKPVLNLRTKGLKSYTPGTCGIHIHMSKSAFSPYHLYKFQKFFFTNKKFIQMIAQRDVQRWASLGEDAEKYLVAKAAGKTTSDKYTAVNISGGPTVEIRIFRGSLKERSFKKNYEFCHALYKYTKQESAMMLTGERFLAFVRENKKTYPNLLEFMEDKYSEEKYVTNTITEKKWTHYSPFSGYMEPVAYIPRWDISLGVTEIDLTSPVSV